MAFTQSKEVARAAILMATTRDHHEEALLRERWSPHTRACAVDYGGEFVNTVRKIIERAVVAAKREGVIGDTHSEEGAVAGATHEAIEHVVSKAIGLNVGGKIGIARKGDHVAVCVFLGIGLLHLDEVAIGLSHRATS